MVQLIKKLGIGLSLFLMICNSALAGWEHNRKITGVIMEYGNIWIYTNPQLCSGGCADISVNRLEPSPGSEQTMLYLTLLNAMNKDYTVHVLRKDGACSTSFDRPIIEGAQVIKP